jgi:hypothetical protein
MAFRQCLTLFKFDRERAGPNADGRNASGRPRSRDRYKERLLLADFPLSSLMKMRPVKAIQRLSGLLLATALAGCATSDFTPYIGEQQLAYVEGMRWSCSQESSATL